MSATEQWIEFEVPDGVSKERADKLLSDSFEQYSRSDFHRAFDDGLVELDGAAIPKNKRLSSGAVVRFRMPEVQSMGMVPIDMDLDVVFEDQHMLVVNKRAGVVVHPGAGEDEATLAHGLLHHCRGQLSGIGGVERPGIVHRLDRETSGLIMVAKSDVAHRALSELFQTRDLIKEYVALVSGVPELLSGVCDRPIERHPTQRHKMRAGLEGRGRAREARTDWRLVKAYDGYSMLRCRIHTGRTHQIRVHMKSIKHIILGDITYGYRKIEQLPAEPSRVMLHSAYLKFVHPITEQELELEAPLPKDFLAFL